MAYNINLNVNNFDVNNISMYTAVTGRGNGPDIDTILQQIDQIQAPNTPFVQIVSYLTCLSRIKGVFGEHKARCESLLTKKLIQLAKDCKNEMQIAIKLDDFSHSNDLKETIEKLDYLSKTFFSRDKYGSHYAAKFWHHVKANYSDNKHSGVAYLNAGVSLAFVGLNIALSNDPTTTNDDTKSNLGLAVAGSSLLFIFGPIIGSGIRALGDKP